MTARSRSVRTRWRQRMGIGYGAAASTVGSLALIVCWAAIIAVLSSQAHLDDNRGGRHFSVGIFVIGHAAFFTALGFLTANGVAGRTHRPIWWTFFLVTAFAVIDELHQAFVPGRDPSAVDLGFDAMGALLGATIFLTGAMWQRSARATSPHSEPGRPGAPALEVAGAARPDASLK